MTYADYFEDDGDDREQIQPFPKKWLSTERFKVGQKVVVFDLSHYLNGGRNVTAEIIEKRDGSGQWPPRRINYHGEPMWLNQSTGWLVVKVPFEISRCLNHETRQYEPRYTIALHLEDEGHGWKVVPA